MNIDIILYMDQRLKRWANWFIHYNDYGIGFSHKTVEARLIEEGGTLIRGTAPKTIPCNPVAEETDRIVKELEAQNPKLARALKEYYFGVDNVKARANRLGVSYSQFKVQVDMAKQWLIGRLSETKPWCRNSNNLLRRVG